MRIFLFSCDHPDRAVWVMLVRVVCAPLCLGYCPTSPWPWAPCPWVILTLSPNPPAICPIGLSLGKNSLYMVLI